MTNLQIQIMILTAQTGSISAAAKSLNISQPSASNSIKAVEKEIGFPVFKRNKKGVMLTEKGSIFIEHAKRLMDEQNQIMNIRHMDEVYTLRLGTVNYYTAVEPFVKLCSIHRDDPKANLLYYNVAIDEGIKELLKHNLDVVIAPVLNSQLKGLRNACKENNISMLKICTIPAKITVRKGHPAALDGRCQSIVQGSDAMKEFPYIALRNLTKDPSDTGYKDEDYIQCSYKMLVDEIDVRLRIIATTNAFSFGCQSSEALLNRYGLVSFPVPGITLDMFCLTHEGESDRREIKEYLNMLREELHFSLRID